MPEVWNVIYRNIRWHTEAETTFSNKKLKAIQGEPYSRGIGGGGGSKVTLSSNYFNKKMMGNVNLEQ